jgi:hypothetical protein
MWQQTSDETTSSPREPARPVSAASILGGSELPRWESFPPQDRHLLVHLLVRTARRQVENQPLAHPGQTRG